MDIGADVIWLAWVGRTKASLNIQLAQVLARKENSIGRLRHAFGKKMVAAQLSEDSKAQQKLEFDNKALEAAIGLTLGK